MKKLVVFTALFATVWANISLADFTIKWFKDENYSRGTSGKKVTVLVTADHTFIFAVTSNWKVPGLRSRGGGYVKFDLPIRTIAKGAHKLSFHLAPPRPKAYLVGYRVSLWKEFVPGTQPLELRNRLAIYNSGDQSGL